MWVRNRKFALFALSIMYVIVTASAGAALELGDISLSSLNPQFLEYQKGESSEEGVRPSPIDLSHLKEQPILRYRGKGADNPPEAFDLVAKGWVSGVKNQSGWGTCWDFATLEAMESNLLVQGLEQKDLSELHLGYFAYKDESADKPAFTASASTDDGNNVIFDNGGFAFLSRAILSRGTGPVYDSEAPYPTLADHPEKDWWVYYDPQLSADMKPAYRLAESLIFVNEDDIKNALMEYGGLWVTYNDYRSSSSPVEEFRREYPYIYTPDEKFPNHAVMLAGWDGAIGRDKFVASPDMSSPAEDGAWKIQNSWGVGRDGKPLGDDGYYWISYEDGTLFYQHGANSFVSMPADTYDYSYLHDPLGACIKLEVDATEVQIANVFVAERDETLVYVGFDTLDNNLEYGIQIYRHLTNASSPVSGTAAYDTPQTGAADAAGYRAVKLDAPLLMEKGERFSVVLTLSTANADFISLPIEANLARYSEKATAGAGESFIFVDDSWQEIRDLDIDQDSGDPLTGFGPFYHGPWSPTNANIKAFTKYAEPTDHSSSSGCSSGVLAGAGAVVLLGLFIRRKR